MADLYPLRFRPLFRRYLWGGRNLATKLGKQLPPGEDYAESWELVDHGADQSLVVHGLLAGQSLGKLTTEHGRELLGRHFPQQRFPLLFKFLDAQQTLSVQVHPDDGRASQLDPPDYGKTEAWVILDREPGSLLYAGLKSGIDRPTLQHEAAQGKIGGCLFQFEPEIGDCIFIPAGLVHAIGAGLLVAEIQQSSDTTYRLYDFDRVGADGKPRLLHIPQALEAIDYGLGPRGPQTAEPTPCAAITRLVHCDKFILDRWTFDTPQTVGGDGRFHLLVVIEGVVYVERDPSGAPLRRGETTLLPASCGSILLKPQSQTTLLDVYLP